MQVRFQEVTREDFDMLKPGSAVLAVQSEVRRIGGGGYRGEGLLEIALQRCNAAYDQVSAYNRIVEVLNGARSMSEVDFCRALDMQPPEGASQTGLIARIRGLLQT